MLVNIIITNEQMVSSTDLRASYDFSFLNGTTPVNGSSAVDVTPPTILTYALFNGVLADAIADYLNTTYSLSLTRANILLPVLSIPAA